ncbi:MAG: glycosyltransferase family 4 protein [Acetobacteraceae bacterium]
MNHKSAGRRTVFLTCPYGSTGGGMGTMMTYLAEHQDELQGDYALRPLESRGPYHRAICPAFVAWAICRMAGEAARGRLAIVHLNLAERGSVWRKAALLYAAKLMGAQVLLHLHAAQIIAYYQSMPAWSRPLLRGMFRTADRSVVLGDLWRRWLIDELGVPARQIAIVRNGVPATALPPLPRSPDAPFRLLFLGNLQERKGVSDLLNALASRPDTERRVMLTMAGGGPIDTYRAKAEALGIADRVIFTGWVEQAEIRRLLAGSDALILPSYDEGLPMVILEAIASSVPVICSPVGAIPEVFEDGKTALFVTPGDSAEIAAAIDRLARNEDLCERLATESNALFRRDFTMTTFAQRIGEIYRSLHHRDRDVSCTPGEPSVSPVGTLTNGGKL